jgi:hypothetical protein
MSIPRTGFPRSFVCSIFLPLLAYCAAAFALAGGEPVPGDNVGHNYTCIAVDSNRRQVPNVPNNAVNQSHWRIPRLFSIAITNARR